MQEFWIWRIKLFLSDRGELATASITATNSDKDEQEQVSGFDGQYIHNATNKILILDLLFTILGWIFFLMIIVLGDLVSHGEGLRSCSCYLVIVRDGKEAQMDT